jgi:hypothetical protein
MNPLSRPSSARFATWIYRGALRLYPAGFRDRYGPEMLEIFRREWSRAAGEGPMSAGRYALHLLGDILRTVPSEWSAVTSRAALLMFAVAVGAAISLSHGSTPMLLKLLGCACFTGAFAGFAIVFFRRGWTEQWKVAVLGIALGFALTFGLGLRPRLTPAPADSLRPVTDPSLTGPEIYRRMEATYREARTYSDEGTVERFLNEYSRPQIQSFRTAFVRGQGFRFEIGNSFGELVPWRYVIWQDGARIKSWQTGAQREDEIVWTDPAVDENRTRTHNRLNEVLAKRGMRPILWSGDVRRAKPGTLNRALDDASAISGRTSFLIPPLLKIESTSHGALSRPDHIIFHGVQPADRDRETVLQRMFDSRIILYGIQRVDGIDTFKLELADGSEPNILWIDVRSSLIRRISRNLTVFGSKPGLRWRETITYHPQLNGSVSAAALTFQPSPDLTDRQRWSWLLLGDESLLLLTALTTALAALIADRLHRRRLQKRGQAEPEPWLIPLRRRLFAGAVGAGAICFGLWLGGVERADVWRNLLLAPFMQQGALLLYAIHRRSREHARFVPTA